MAKKSRPTGLGYGPDVWRMVGRGIELGAIIGGLTFLGHLGDQRFDTGPWLTLAGAVLATVGGSYNLAKDMLMPIKRKPANDGDNLDRDKHDPDRDKTDL